MGAAFKAIQLALICFNIIFMFNMKFMTDCSGCLVFYRIPVIFYTQSPVAICVTSFPIQLFIIIYKLNILAIIFIHNFPFEIYINKLIKRNWTPNIYTTSCTLTVHTEYKQTRWPSISLLHWHWHGMAWLGDCERKYYIYKVEHYQFFFTYK